LKTRKYAVNELKIIIVYLFKNLAKYRSENNLDRQNDYVGRSN